MKLVHRVENYNSQIYPRRGLVLFNGGWHLVWHWGVNKLRGFDHHPKVFPGDVYKFIRVSRVEGEFEVEKKL